MYSKWVFTPKTEEEKKIKEKKKKKSKKENSTLQWSLSHGIALAKSDSVASGRAFVDYLLNILMVAWIWKSNFN
jgi:hypothetical protein